MNWSILLDRCGGASLIGNCILTTAIDADCSREVMGRAGCSVQQHVSDGACSLQRADPGGNGALPAARRGSMRAIYSASHA